MPNRLIREGFLDSKRIDSLSAEAERLYVRLLISCDDAGRFDARPDLVAFRCFPNRRNIRPERIKPWMDELQDAKLVVLYEHKGRPLLQILRWQRCSRSAFSKFPWVDGGFAITFETIETPRGMREVVATSIEPARVTPNNTPSAWDRHGIGMGSASHRHGVQGQVPETKTETKTKTNNYSSEPLRDSEPPAANDINLGLVEPPKTLVVFDVVGDPKHPTWNFTESYMETLKTAFPNIDVLVEIRKADVWIKSNPTKRKTAKGMTRFLYAWIERAQNGGRNGQPGQNPQGRTEARRPGYHDPETSATLARLMQTAAIEIPADDPGQTNASGTVADPRPHA